MLDLTPAITARIVEAVDPIKIVLFGSRARGDGIKWIPACAGMMRRMDCPP